MSIYEVVKNKKCMSCGMCSSICPVAAINMQYNVKTGFYVPVINEALCIKCDICEKSCPGVIKYKSHSLMGNYIELLLGHSSDRKIRNGATSGGVINSLVRYVLNCNIVDAVLLTKYDAESPIEASGQFIIKKRLSEMSEEPRDFASRYVTVPLLKELKNIDKSIKRIAVVGTPCQINAVSHSKKFKELVSLRIGVTCSGGMSYKATEQYKKIEKMNVSKMYYRGKGWPGYNTLIQDDQRIEFEHMGSLFERMFSSQIFKNPACRNCADHFAECADVSFCDFWDKEEMRNEKEGNSCIIIRNETAKRIIDGMVESNYVEIEKELTEQEILNTQMFVVKAKKGNLKQMKKFSTFSSLVDIIFKTRLYRFFSFKIYRKFSSYYTKLCNQATIDDNNIF